MVEPDSIPEVVVQLDRKLQRIGNVVVNRSETSLKYIRKSVGMFRLQMSAPKSVGQEKVHVNKQEHRRQDHEPSIHFESLRRNGVQQSVASLIDEQTAAAVVFLTEEIGEQNQKMGAITRIFTGVHEKR